MNEEDKRFLIDLGMVCVFLLVGFGFLFTAIIVDQLIYGVFGNVIVFCVLMLLFRIERKYFKGEKRGSD